MKKIILIILISCISFNVFANKSFSYITSYKCIEHIKLFESCSLVSYWDSNGYSIGYGHHSKDVKKGMKISQSQANKYLKEDIKKATISANRLINNLPYSYKFSQSFFDGLVDLVYNCGEGGIKSSNFYQRLSKCRVKNGVMNKQDYEYTLTAVKSTNISSKGHVKRRELTYKMMKKC